MCEEYYNKLGHCIITILSLLLFVRLSNSLLNFKVEKDFNITEKVKLCAQRNKGLRNWSLKIQESNAKLSPKPSPVKYIIIGKLTGHHIILL